ncbi:HNH endonuclease, partial [Streptomyces sp. AK08-02]|uniref:HNH endonuclease n=1 Tax=Streptomyces sp. AK08-02 TaxID=3028654 RepID=UPI0029B3CCBD
LHTYYVLAEDTPVLVHNCNRAGLDFTDAERQKVYDANAAKNGGEYKCDYCGQTVERRASRDANGNAIKGRPDDAQIDHVEPKASGGHGGDHNGAVACRRCNRDKSTKPLEDWDDELRDFLDD